MIRRIINVGVPKGSVRSLSIRLVSGLLDRTIVEAKLSHTDERQWAFYFLKHRDIPSLVSEGQLDIGITSTEWLIERAPELIQVGSLSWCESRISLIGTPALRDRLQERSWMSCITEYPVVARRYFEMRGLASRVRLITVSGSSEALVPELFDCAVECVETGATLTANGLIELEPILQSSVTIAVRANKQEELAEKTAILFDAASRTSPPENAKSNLTLAIEPINFAECQERP
jgi:ATP phosphoribosyltransferase